MLECVGEGVLKEYKNLAHNRGLQGGDRSVHQVGAGSDREAVMVPAEAEVGKGVDEDDYEDEPAQMAVCAFVASNLHKGGNWRSWKPLQQNWKKRDKKEPRRVGDPPLSFLAVHPDSPQGLLRLLRAELALLKRPPDPSDQQGRHEGEQEGTRDQEACVSQRLGIQGGSVQGGDLQAADGRNRSCEGDSGSQESLES